MQHIIFAPIRAVEKWLDKTSMYTVVLAALGSLCVAALGLSMVGLGAASVSSMVFSWLVLVVVAVVVSVGCGKLFGVTAHHLSSCITALILFLILSPATTQSEYLVLAGTAAAAILSKYILQFRRQHVVNAAAVAVFALALSGYGAATWWVATPYMLIPLVLAGGAVVTKMRTWPMILSFGLVGFATFLFESWRFGDDIAGTWLLYFLSYPTLFLAFFMLTEPFTLPPTRNLRMLYGALVGFLGSTSLISFLYITPELALLLGNLAMYPFTLRRKLHLSFISKREIGPLLYELTFQKPNGLRFLPGQYVEWMLPHGASDSRGIRRYFTIVSSPTESVFKLACKVPTPGSSYKQALLALVPGDMVIASQLAGDFVLPKNPATKLAWVAGGIGVTPFVSQAVWLQDTASSRDITLLYAANSPAELVYESELATVATVVPVLATGTLPGSETGYISADMIVRRVPEYLDRTWYVSGPPGMVAATTQVLRTLGVPKYQIVRDFFPGLA